MLLSQYVLYDGATRLRNIEKGIRSSDNDLENTKTKIYGITLDMILAAEEYLFCTDDYEYKRIKDRLTLANQTIKNTEDADEIKQAINSTLNEYFPPDRDYHNQNISNYRRVTNQGFTQYNPLEEFSIQGLTSCIQTPQRELNILDPRCRDGINIKRFRDNLSRPGTTPTAYGIETEPGTANVAKSNIENVAIGSLIGSRISNEAFDVMVVEPPLTLMINDVSIAFSKQEKTFLYNVYKYIRPNGMVVILLPYFRMYKDICLMLSKYLDNIQARKMAGNDFYSRGLIAIVGTRSNKKEACEETYRMLRRLNDAEHIQDIAINPFNPIVLPQESIEIETFRGSIMDTDEMSRLVRTSGCFDAFWKAQDVEKIHENTKQPLLPFNIGQIGLVLTSGCLDGVVDEGDGHYHLIKGKVSKKTSVEREMVGNNNVEVNETISNRVEINVMMANGEYKILA